MFIASFGYSQNGVCSKIKVFNNITNNDTSTYVYLKNNKKIIIKSYFTEELIDSNDLGSYRGYLYFSYNLINNDNNKTVFYLSGIAITKSFDPDTYDNVEGPSFLGKKFDYYFANGNCHLTIIAAFDTCDQIQFVGNPCLSNNKNNFDILTNTWFYEAKEKIK